MSEYLIIRILILIIAIRSIRSIDILDYEGEINVLGTFGLTKSNEPNNFIRFQKSYVIHALYSGFQQESELKSFAFQSIFRIDDAIANTNKNAFIFFSFRHINNYNNKFQIGINGNNELKFEIVSENFNNTITRETIYPNYWNKLIVFYKNGDLEYWLNCRQHNGFSFFPPNNLQMYFYNYYGKPIFPFSAGHFDVSDNKTLLDIGGNFDIKRMKFYSGYLRPYENDCSDIP